MFAAQVVEMTQLLHSRVTPRVSASNFTVKLRRARPACMWVILKRLRGALVRPSFIVAEPEPEQALSSRKLLLETFKFNVITAHSVPETLEMVQLFPRCDALIVHCGL